MSAAPDAAGRTRRTRATRAEVGDPSKWRTLLAQGSGVIEDFAVAGDRVVVEYVLSPMPIDAGGVFLLFSPAKREALKQRMHVMTLRPAEPRDRCDSLHPPAVVGRPAASTASPP